jgi:hypothetical protein
LLVLVRLLRGGLPFSPVRQMAKSQERSSLHVAERNFHIEMNPWT